VSEGTLRLIGLLALQGVKMPPTLIGFEEPENGVHPRRISLIAEFLNLTPAVGGAGDRLRGAVSLRDERFAGGFGRSPIGRSPDG
jgi:hypothetical protein